MVAQFDTNSDGDLSADERATAIEARRAEFAASFDLDQDGELSESEQSNLESVAQSA